MWVSYPHLSSFWDYKHELSILLYGYFYIIGQRTGLNMS
jgi:hypothetical protein